jgi:pyridoxine kinase
MSERAQEPAGPASGQAIPRAVLANDLPGFGRVALAASIPVLSAMGIQACALPTAVLSSHGAWPGVRMTALTAAMEQTLAHWRELGLAFGAAATGFVAEPAQFPLLESLVAGERERGGLTLVDPVLGDNGRLYGLFDQSMVAAMRRLAAQAAVITPNLTEAALLLGLPPDTRPASRTELDQWLAALAGTSADLVVITSAPVFGREPAADWTALAAWERRGPGAWHIEHRREPVGFPGTGDVLAACLLGRLLKGDIPRTALDRSAGFIRRLVAHSARCLAEQGGGDPRDGLRIEAFLGEIPG